MATLITHVYNEEFLLPFFIKHHQKLFDRFIVIYFESNDDTLKILQTLAPNWQVIPSRTDIFDAKELDLQIMEIEKELQGPRITLTVTEFLIGDPRYISQQLIIPSINLINMSSDRQFDNNKSFMEQRSFAVSPSGYFENYSVLRGKNSTNLLTKSLFLTSSSGRSKSGRSIHAKQMEYSIGRHFYALLPNNFLIVRVSNCFVNQQMIDRRLQIQSRLPNFNSNLSKVHHSNFGKGLSYEDLMIVQKFDRSIAEDYSDEIMKRLTIMEASLSIESLPSESFHLIKKAYVAISEIQEHQQVSFFNRNISKSDNEIDIVLSRIINYADISYKLKNLVLLLLNYFVKISRVQKKLKSFFLGIK
jgi:hypothetical protein